MWDEGDKVYIRESEEHTFDFIKYVVRWEYDDTRGGWDYKVQDEAGREYGPLVKETDMMAA